MSLFAYLRRALSSLRVGVGGIVTLNPFSIFPKRSTDAPSNIGDMPRFVSYMPPVLFFNRISDFFSAAMETIEFRLNAFQITLKKASFKVHLTTLPARSSKCHGPLVPCFTGGNA